MERGARQDPPRTQRIERKRETMGDEGRAKEDRKERKLEIESDGLTYNILETRKQER